MKLFRNVRLSVTVLALCFGVSGLGANAAGAKAFASLEGLSLKCPATLDPGESGTCRARASYSNGKTRVVSPVWSTSREEALILIDGSSSGNLIGGAAATDVALTVSADYSEGGVNKTATATVTVKAAATPNNVFKIHNDGTVTDKRTRLTWKRCAEGQTWSGSTCTGAAQYYNWDEAMALGSNGWELPTVAQLLTIVDAGHASPTYNQTIFPNATTWSLWSSTSYLGAMYVIAPYNAPLANAWVVSDTSYSTTGNAAGVDYKPRGMNVRLVRVDKSSCK